ncbi:MAG: hypothetical protein MEQ07_09260 [Aquimonas sp.]|nr:hypothetical protein [Aquimonas sp.]
MSAPIANKEKLGAIGLQFHSLQEDALRLHEHVVSRLSEDDRQELAAFFLRMPISP